MTKEEKEILVTGYSFKIAQLLQKNDWNNLEEFRNNLYKCIDYVNELIRITNQEACGE